MGQGRFLISVIVPCFNHGHYLAEALESLACQTYENWECVIIDDGSSDNTRDVASHFVRRDSRYRYFQDVHKGPGASRNRGLSIACGDLIQFLDADDVICRNKFEVQVAALGTRESLRISHCNYSLGRRDCITEAAKVKALSSTFIYRKPIYDIALRWAQELSIPIHCFLFDSRIFRDYGIRFDESLPNNEDWDCWMRVFALEPESLFTDRVLAIYRLPGMTGNVSGDPRAMYAGFVSALAKQAAAWAHDPIMSGLLRIMRRRVKHMYPPYLRRGGLASDFLERAAQVYARTVPWPLQRAVNNFKKARQEPNAKLLSRITRAGL
jgi:glycosyltransferase involved in cell wall biosynthesis